ncbi:MAG: prepilin peptidase [Acidimicrobiia bacterium]
MSQTIEIAIAALYGAIVGSFLTVVIGRVPAHESIVRPRSRCGACGTQLTTLDLIPIISWCARRGRCAHCGAKVSVRYVMVELITAAVFGSIVWRYGLDGRSVVLCTIAAGLVALSAIDLETFKLPNAIVYPLSGMGAAGIVVVSAIESEYRSGMLRALLGAVIVFCAFFVLHLISPKSMGFGDVRLSALLGGSTAWIAWGVTAVSLFAAFAFGALIGTAMLLIGRAGRKTALPFGPMLAAGWLFGLLYGPQIADAYLSANH